MLKRAVAQAALVFLLTALPGESASNRRSTLPEYRIPPGVTNLYFVELTAWNDQARERIFGLIRVSSEAVEAEHAVTRLRFRGRLTIGNWSSPVKTYRPSHQLIAASINFGDSEETGTTLTITPSGQFVETDNTSRWIAPLGSKMGTFVPEIPPSASRSHRTSDSRLLMLPTLSTTLPGGSSRFIYGPWERIVVQPSTYSYTYGNISARSPVHLLRVEREQILSAAPHDGGILEATERISSLETVEGVPVFEATNSLRHVFDRATTLPKEVLLSGVSVLRKAGLPQLQSCEVRWKLLASTPQSVAPETFSSLLLAGGLPQLSDREIRDHVRLLQSPELITRREAALALASDPLLREPKELADALAVAISDDDAYVRNCAMRMFLARAQPAHRDACIKAMERHAWPDPRLGPAVILQRIGDAGCVAAYCRSLARNSEALPDRPFFLPSIQRPEVQALAAIGSAAERDVLRLLSNENPAVIRNACLVLARIGTPVSRDPLLKLIAHPNAFASEAAAQALRSLAGNPTAATR